MSVYLGLIEKESRGGKESNLTPLSFLHKSKGNFILTIAMPTSTVASGSELVPGLRLCGFRSLPHALPTVQPWTHYPPCLGGFICNVG